MKTFEIAEAAASSDHRHVAYSIVSAIASVVPASQWAFASISAAGALDPVFGSESAYEFTGLLGNEYRRLRLRGPGGPKISMTECAAKPYPTGVTLLFADTRLTYGILTLLRTAEIGSFTAPELSMLAFALDAVSEYLSASRLQPPKRHSAMPSRGLPASFPAEGDGAFYVLDDDLRIVLASGAGDGIAGGLGLDSRPGDRLPALLEQTVRAMTATWPNETVRQPAVARPVTFLVIRTRPMWGSTGVFTGVRIDRYREPNSLTAMAERFHISPREIQVLALLLDGNRLDQIAGSLYITSSTVQDHVKSMLDKTDSRNRSELISRVLGWKFKRESAEL